jgi:hypothetical protein
MSPSSPKPRKKAGRRTPGSTTGRVAIQNVNVPGYTVRVDAAKYQAMRRALLKLLPSSAPGLTQTQMQQALRTQVPRALFPNGGKVSWWAKVVQLDLEAKGLVQREKATPLRWHRA